MNYSQPAMIFITDLDRTIIHSNQPEYPAVEWIGERPITYLSEKAQVQFHSLLKHPAVEVVPCTMRSLAQVKRIQCFDEQLPRFVIASNGTQIYEDGVLDEVWHQKMRALISLEALQHEKQQVEVLDLPPVEVRITEAFYLTLKFESEAEATQAMPVLKGTFPPRKKQVFQVGRKIFILHPDMDKVHAVDYLMQGQAWEENVYTAGDSLADQRFTRRGKALLPAHATFVGKPDSIRTQASGMLATEEILAYLHQQLATHKEAKV